MSLSDIYYSALWIPLVAPTPGGGGVPQPTGGGSAPPELVDKVEQVLNLIAWGGTAAGVVGVLITGTVMAISHRRGGGSEHTSRLGLVLGGCILVATAGPIVGWLFGGGGDGG
jgi:hypothetical protein